MVAAVIAGIVLNQASPLTYRATASHATREPVVSRPAQLLLRLRFFGLFGLVMADCCAGGGPSNSMSAAHFMTGNRAGCRPFACTGGLLVGVVSRMCAYGEADEDGGQDHFTHWYLPYSGAD